MKMLRFLVILLALLWSPLLAEAGSKTLHNAATANATGSNISVEDKGMVGLMVTISGTATITTQGSTDGGTTWNNIGCTSIAASTSSTTITATGQYLCQVSGLSHVQAPLSGCSGCTVTVKIVTSNAPLGPVFGLDANGNLEVTLATRISGEDTLADVIRVGAPDVEQVTVMSFITSNTTAPAVLIPGARIKSFYGEVVCSSGACTQTQEIFCDINADGVNGVSLGTITLSGNPRDQYVLTGIEATCSYYYVTTTNTTGTAASGAMYAMFGN